MTRRIKASRQLLKLGTFIRSLPVVVMKTDDLVEFSRLHYHEPQTIESWAADSIVDSGLSENELELIQAIPVTRGTMLVLGLGGGREAIVFARMGFSVTGVDFVAELVDKARENATKRELNINGLVQNYAHLDLVENSFDVIWMTRAMYSSIPTRSRRVKMVHQIKKALKPGGFFICQFHLAKQSASETRLDQIRKAVAFFACGNREYEPGDKLWGDVEFLHSFSDQGEVRLELEEAGLQFTGFIPSDSKVYCGAICNKS